VRLGPYSLDQELGRGASGVVYRGRSPQGQLVAVKLLATQTPEVLERFQREARLHEQLGAEAGFVPFLDMGLAENRPYLVMPLLQGGTLRDRLQRGPLTVRGAIELGQRLATALGQAHALGIVHRDVKPENVLFDSQGHAFLADLGMAKHFRHDVTGASQSVVLSQAGEVRGTVSYMPPEQLTDASSAGPAADVFALGAVLYECLSGEPAFNADSYVELLVQIVDAIHVPLRKRCEAPPWLSSVIEACLSKDASKRPAEGLALASLLAEGPTLGAKRSARVRQTAAALFGLSVLGSAIAGAVLLKAQPQATPSAAQASPSQTASAPSPSPLDTTPAASRFPAAWSPLLRSEHLTLEASWQPEGVSRASQVAITHEGVMVVGEKNVLALSEGPPRPLVRGLPGLRRASAFCADDSLFLLQEKTRFRLFKLEDGDLRCEVTTKPEGRLATYAFGGVSTVVAHGKRLATYKSLANGTGQENPKFATLTAEPRLLAASKAEVLAAHGSLVTFLNVLGRVRLLRDYKSPVVALTYRRGPPGEALIGTKDGVLHCQDDKRVLRASIETGLAPLQALCAGRRFAALAGETALALVDLETLEVFDRLDLSALESEIVGLGLSPDEDALVLGTENGQVLRYALRPPGQEPLRVLGPKQAWGDRAGRHAKAVNQVSATERYLLSADSSGAIHVWDPATGEALRTIQASRRTPRFAIGASGRLWAIDLGRVRQWDVATGHELARISLEHGAFNLSLREDEQELALLGFRSDVEIWNLISHRRRLSRRFEIPGKTPRRIALLEDGSFLIGYAGGTLALRDSAGAEIWTRQAGQTAVASMEPLGGGRVLVACSGGEVSIWSRADGRRTLRFKAQPMNSISSSGNKILLGFSPGRIEMRSAETGEALWDRAGEVGIQPWVSLRSEDEIFLGGADQLVRRVQVKGQGPGLEDLWPKRSGKRRLLTLGFESGDKLTTIERGRATTFDPATGRELSQLDLGIAGRALWGRTHFLTLGVPRDKIRQGVTALHAWAVGAKSPPWQVASPAPTSFVLSADGRVAAHRTKRGGKSGVEIRDLVTRDTTFLETGLNMGLNLSARGELLAMTRSGGLNVWSVADNKRVASLSSPAALLAFLPTTPPLLFEAQLYGKVRILDPVEGRVLSTFTPRARRRPLLAQPDPRGGRIALSFADGRIELWSVPQGKRLVRLEGEDPSDSPSALAFSPEGDQLAVLTGRGRVIVFSVPR